MENGEHNGKDFIYIQRRKRGKLIARIDELALSCEGMSYSNV
jgi:hypothetical protein